MTTRWLQSFLLLVVRPGATSSVLLFLVAMPFVTSSILAPNGDGLQFSDFPIGSGSAAFAGDALIPGKSLKLDC